MAISTVAANNARTMSAATSLPDASAVSANRDTRKTMDKGLIDEVTLSPLARQVAAQLSAIASSEQTETLTDEVQESPATQAREKSLEVR